MTSILVGIVTLIAITKASSIIASLTDSHYGTFSDADTPPECTSHVVLVNMSHLGFPIEHNHMARHLAIGRIPVLGCPHP